MKGQRGCVLLKYAKEILKLKKKLLRCFNKVLCFLGNGIAQGGNNNPGTFNIEGNQFVVIFLLDKRKNM